MLARLWEKNEDLCIISGTKTNTTTMEIIMEGPPITKSKNSIGPDVLRLGLKGLKTSCTVNILYFSF